MIHPLVILGLSFVLAACAGSAAPPAWQKPGATKETVGVDTTECQTQARQHAARIHPHDAGAAIFGPSAMIASQQQTSTDRIMAETAALNDCMEARGYTRQQPPRS